jgi:putrescine aminotransferase
MVVPTEEYWPRIRELCDRYEILLIADEIVSGFGRTGRMFGFQNFGFEPDLFVVAKGITSGYFPVSAVGIGEKVAGAVLKSNQIFAHIFTNCGHPVGAAVALENLAVIEELGLVNKVRDETGPYLSKRMQELMEFPCVGEVRAIGVMGAFEIDASGGARTTSQPENDALLSDITSIVWRRGAIVRAGALCMPMVSTKQQIDEVIDILKASIEEAWGKLRAAA